MPLSHSWRPRRKRYNAFWRGVQCFRIPPREVGVDFWHFFTASYGRGSVTRGIHRAARVSKRSFRTLDTGCWLTRAELAKRARFTCPSPRFPDTGRLPLPDSTRAKGRPSQSRSSWGKERDTNEYPVARSHIGSYRRTGLLSHIELGSTVKPFPRPGKRIRSRRGSQRTT